jgi:hypothetical protein
LHPAVVHQKSNPLYTASLHPHIAICMPILLPSCDDVMM